MLSKWAYLNKGSLYTCMLGGLLATLMVGAATELIVSLIATSQVERLRSETTEKLATMRAQL